MYRSQKYLNILYTMHYFFFIVFPSLILDVKILSAIL